MSESKSLVPGDGVFKYEWITDLESILQGNDRNIYLKQERIHMPKPIKLYNLNMCNSVYFNYTTVKVKYQFIMYVWVYKCQS